MELFNTSKPKYTKEQKKRMEDAIEYLNRNKISISVVPTCVGGMLCLSLRDNILFETLVINSIDSGIKPYFDESSYELVDDI